MALQRDEAGSGVGRRAAKGGLSLAENLTTLKSASLLPTSLRLLSSFSIPILLLLLPKPASSAMDGPKTPFLSLALSALDFAAAATIKFYFAAARRKK